MSQWNVQDASKAREDMNGREFQGHKIRVDYSLTREAHKPTPGVYFHQGKAYKPGGIPVSGGDSRGGTFYLLQIVV